MTGPAPYRTGNLGKHKLSVAIAHQTEQFLSKGGKIDRAGLRETKHVDLTWRNYAATAMEESGDDEEV